MGEAEPSYPTVTADWQTRHGRRQWLHCLGNTRSIVSPGQSNASASAISMQTSTYRNECNWWVNVCMETQTAISCRHVASPDHPDVGCRFLPLVRGPVTIQGVRDPAGVRSPWEVRSPG